MNNSQLTGGENFNQEFKSAYDEKLWDLVKNYLSMNFSFEDLPSLIEKIKSENFDDNLFLKDSEKLFEEFDISGIVQHLINHLRQINFPQLQIESVMVLNKLFSIQNLEEFHDDINLCFLVLLNSQYPHLVKEVNLEKKKTFLIINFF